MSSQNSTPPNPPASPFGGPTSHTPVQNPYAQLHRDLGINVDISANNQGRAEPIVNPMAYPGDGGIGNRVMQGAAGSGFSPVDYATTRLGGNNFQGPAAGQHFNTGVPLHIAAYRAENAQFNYAALDTGLRNVTQHFAFDPNDALRTPQTMNDAVLLAHPDYQAQAMYALQSQVANIFRPGGEFHRSGQSAHEYFYSRQNNHVNLPMVNMFRSAGVTGDTPQAFLSNANQLLERHFDPLFSQVRGIVSNIATPDLRMAEVGMQETSAPAIALAGGFANAMNRTGVQQAINFPITAVASQHATENFINSMARVSPEYHYSAESGAAALAMEGEDFLTGSFPTHPGASPGLRMPLSEAHRAAIDVAAGSFEDVFLGENQAVRSGRSVNLPGLGRPVDRDMLRNLITNPEPDIYEAAINGAARTETNLYGEVASGGGGRVPDVLVGGVGGGDGGGGGGGRVSDILGGGGGDGGGGGRGDNSQAAFIATMRDLINALNANTNAQREGGGAAGQLGGPSNPLALPAPEAAPAAPTAAAVVADPAMARRGARRANRMFESFLDEEMIRSAPGIRQGPFLPDDQRDDDVLRQHNQSIVRRRTAAGAVVGFGRGLFGMQMQETDTEAAKNARTYGMLARFAGRGIIAAASQFGSPTGGNFSAMLEATPGFRRGFENLGLLTQLGEMTSNFELPILQTNRLLGDTSSMSASESVNTGPLRDMIKRGLTLPQALQALQGAAAASGGGIQSGALASAATDLTMNGLDAGAYFGNIGQMRAYGFNQNPGMEFSIASRMGLTGNQALSMQGQLFGSFLPMTQQNIGITRENFYSDITRMGRMSDGGINIAQGQAVFGRGQGVVGGALSMLNAPMQGVAESVLMANALARTGGNRHAARRLLEQQMARGGSGALRAMMDMGMSREVAVEALESSGLTTRDIGRLTQGDGLTGAGDLYSSNLGSGKALQFSRELAETQRQGMEAIDQNFDAFKQLEVLNRRTTRYQVDRTAINMGAQNLDDLFTAASKVTDAFDQLATTVRNSSAFQFMIDELKAGNIKTGGGLLGGTMALFGQLGIKF